MNKLCYLFRPDILLFFLFAIYEFYVSISAGVYVVKDYDIANKFMVQYDLILKNLTLIGFDVGDAYLDCDIWSFSVAGCVIDASVAISLSIIVCYLIVNEGDYYCPCEGTIIIPALCAKGLLSGIGCGILTYMASQCSDFWKPNTPDLWFLLEMNYYISWVFVGLIVLSCVVTLVVMRTCDCS